MIWTPERHEFFARRKERHTYIMLEELESGLDGALGEIDRLNGMLRGAEMRIDHIANLNQKAVERFPDLMEERDRFKRKFMRSEELLDRAKGLLRNASDGLINFTRGSAQNDYFRLIAQIEEFTR